MSTSTGILAWYQLADSNQMIFNNALCNDVLVRTSIPTQRVLIGSYSNGLSAPSTITVTNSNTHFNGDLRISNGNIVSSTNNSLQINQVTVSNNTLTLSNLVATSGATVQGNISALGLSIRNVTIVDSNGNFATSNIPDLSLTGAKIANFTITNNKYGNQSVDTPALSNQSITAPKFFPGAVDTFALSNQSVTTGKYAPNSVDSTALASIAVRSQHLFPQSVDTPAIRDSNVTSAKLSANLNLIGSTTVAGRMGINVANPNAASALDISGPITLSSNNGRVSIHSSGLFMGVMQSNPLYTLDVLGDINFTGSMYQGGSNGIRFNPSQWSQQNSSVPNSGCNIAYTGGYVGVGTNTPLSQLHIGRGSLTVDSNIFFNNATSNQVTWLSSSSSNVGVRLMNPQASLDIGGSLGINNTTIVDGSRNLTNINIGQMLKLGVNTTSPPVYTLDVVGDARFNAKRFTYNSNMIVLSSAGEIFGDTAFYKIADLKATNDTNNFGSFVIRGDIGNRAYDASGYINIVVATRDSLTKTGQPYSCTSQMMGCTPSVITPFIDILLYKNADETFTVYIKGTLNSHFNLEVQGGRIISTIYTDWYLNKSLTAPSGTFQRSLISDAQAFTATYDGRYTFGGSVEVGGNIANTGIIRSYDPTSKSNLSLEVERTPQSTFLTVNSTRPSGSNTWYASHINKNSLQIDFKTSTTTDGADAGIFFNTTRSLPGNTTTPLAFSNMMVVRPDGVGVGTSNPMAKLQVGGHTIVNGTLYIGSSNLSSSNVEMVYTHQGDGADSNMFDIGFTGLRIMTMTTKSNTGFGKRNPTERLDVAGNAQFDGVINCATGANTKKLVSFASTIQNQSATNARWFKIAFLQATALSPYNRATIAATGTLINEADGMQFKLTMLVDASSSSSSVVQVDYHTGATNYFRSVFDIVAYVDANYNVHVYAKSSATKLIMNMDVSVNQSVGSSVTTYTNRTYTGITFSDSSFPVLAVDTSVIGPVQFVVSTQGPNTQVMALNKFGNLGLGTENPTTRLHVQGTCTTDAIMINTGALSTGQNGLFVNGIRAFDAAGNFNMGSLSNGSITYNLLDVAAVSNILQSVKLSNLYPYTNGLGIFTSNPQYPLDVNGTVALNTGASGGRVLLTTSTSNGLGINVPSPKFALDIGGDYNFTGKIYRNGVEFYTHPFATCNNTLYFGSNIGLGQGIVNPSEPLSVLTTFSLSNASGKTILYSSNTFLGINNTTPLHALDVGGNTIALNGVPFINSNMNLSNIITVTTPSLTATRSNVGVNNRNPVYDLDVMGSVNFSGSLLKNGQPFFSSQWNGSNLGVTYCNRVGIRVDVPASESLSVLSNMSFSNGNGKVTLAVLQDANALQCSHSLIATTSVALSNASGVAAIYQNSSNLGVSTSNPQCTLDVNGNFGISGTPLFNEARVLSNVPRLYTDVITATNTRVGIGIRDPTETLTVSGSIGISNQGFASLSVLGGEFVVATSRTSTSNLTVQQAASNPGVVVQTSSNTLPGLQVRGQAPSIQLLGTQANNATFMTFVDGSSNIARIGMDGTGFNGASQYGVFTMSTANDARLMTRGQARIRLLGNGQVGIGTEVPNFTLDVGGTGIGVAGAQVIDANRNIFGTSARFSSAMAVRSIAPNALSLIIPTSVELILTSTSGSVRSTATQSTGYQSFSNLVFSNPGKIVMTAGSNMYFGGTDGVGSAMYTNFAYQPLQAGTDIAGNSNVSVDVFVMNESNVNNIVGNGRIAASTWEMVNPGGHAGFTTFRMRNWDPMNVYNTASNASSNYFEIKMDNAANIAKLNADKDIVFANNDQNILAISGAQATINVQENINFRVSTLGGNGTKPVYSDAFGNLTNSVSDARLKEQVADSVYGIEEVMALRPVSFKWNSQYQADPSSDVINLQELRGTRKELGLIAQELQQVIPEVVGDNVDGTLYVDYPKLIPVLIKAIQELKVENDAIKTKLQEMSSSRIA